MSPADLRSARAALDVARPAVVRLDVEHAPHHAAGDLRDAWAATETALRAAVGGSGLAGPALVGEARTRGLLEYPHAHALLAFQSAADRATFPDYRATVDDVAAARAGFQALEAALGLGIAADTASYSAVARPAPVGGPPTGSPSPFAPPASPAQQGLPQAHTPPYTPPAGYAAPAPRPSSPTPRPAVAPTPTHAVDVGASYGEPDDARAVPRPRRRGLSAGLLGALLALAAVAVGLVLLVTRNRSSTLDQAVAEFKAGQREAARRDFQRAAEANSGAALPHVYLARMAREDGDLPRASSELETATRLEPSNALARREIGLLLLQTNHPDRAIEYLRTAVQADPTDRVALGWLGCALVRVGNASLAQSFFQRSGPGDWSACRPDAAAGSGAPATAAPAPTGAL